MPIFLLILGLAGLSGYIYWGTHDQRSWWQEGIPLFALWLFVASIAAVAVGIHFMVFPRLVQKVEVESNRTLRSDSRTYLSSDQTQGHCVLLMIDEATGLPVYYQVDSGPLMEMKLK